MNYRTRTNTNTRVFSILSRLHPETQLCQFYLLILTWVPFFKLVLISAVSVNSSQAKILLESWDDFLTNKFEYF